MPFRNIMGFQMDSFLIRTPEGREFLSYPWAIGALAEGELWRKTVTGSRFPAPLMEANQLVYPPKRLPILDREAWREANPRKNCVLWLNEKKTGTRLLDAELRQDMDDLSPLTERTPKGLNRINGGTDLERDD